MKPYLLTLFIHHPNADPFDSKSKLVMEVYSKNGLKPRINFHASQDHDSEDITRQIYIIKIYGADSYRIVQEIGSPTQRGLEISKGYSNGVPQLAILYPDSISADVEFPDPVEEDQE